MRVSALLMGVLLGLMAAPPALAQSRPPAQATQHALDELANAIAQGRITLTPTPTPTLTTTPTATPTMTPEPETETPTPAATAVPSLPNSREQIAAYLRPSARPDAGEWLELALPSGRWDVLTDCGDTLVAWTDAMLLGKVLHAPDEAWLCGIVASAWVSDAPCTTGDDDACSLEADGGYWDWLALQLPAEDPTVEPSQTTALTSTPRPPAVPVREVGAQIQRVVETVVVIQTVVVTRRVGVTARPTPWPTSTPTPAARPSATSTSVVVVARPTAASAPPIDTLGRARPLLDESNRAWLFGIVLGAMALGAGWFWLSRGRRRYVL